MDQQQSFADPDALMRRVSEMIEAGRLGVARPLLAAVKRLAPPPPRIAELSARLAMREGRLDDAEAELDDALGAAPEDSGLHKRRAELRMRTGNLTGAAEDAADAVILRRDDPAAKALLGVVLIGLGRPTDALPCLQEAVAAEPDNPSFRQGLSAAQDAIGDGPAAAATLEGGISECPGSVGLRNAAVLHRVRGHDFEGAVALAEQARQDGVADACLYGLKGHALSSLERHEVAAEAYAEALKLGPEDPYVRHLVAASGGLPGGERAPADYLRAVFDGYAERFDAHLLSLGYRAPGLFRAALLRLLPGLSDGETTGPVLDLGCGTGLAAVAVSDLPLHPIIGVDLSPGMLREAAAKQLYAELHEADVVAALAQDARPYRVILAADVFCYFGSLDEVLAAVHRRLLDDGLFLFSLEELPSAGETPDAGGRDWALGRLGRYGHSAAYVERAASSAGFVIREAERETLRCEMGAPVPGLIIALQRRAA
jgi:predicted TPR repeat methyltransferase